jgi:hypothetical protein
VLDLRDRNPTRDVVVVIPDLVTPRWYHALLHNHRGAILRALLRLRGGPRVIVVSTPLHLVDGAGRPLPRTARYLQTKLLAASVLPLPWYVAVCG